MGINVFELRLSHPSAKLRLGPEEPRKDLGAVFFLGVCMRAWYTYIAVGPNDDKLLIHIRKGWDTHLSRWNSASHCSVAQASARGPVSLPLPEAGEGPRKEEEDEAADESRPAAPAPAPLPLVSTSELGSRMTSRRAG